MVSSEPGAQPRTISAPPSRRGLPPQAGADSRRELDRVVRELDEAQRDVARYRALVHAVASDVWITDPDGQLTSDLAAWRATTGQSAGEVRGEGWLDAVHPADRERARRTWRRAVAEQAPYECEYRVGPPRGDPNDATLWRAFAVRGTPVIRDGVVVEWVGLSIDVSDRRLAEEAEIERDRLQGLLALASDSLAASLDRREVLTTLTDLCVPAMADWACVHLLAPGQGEDVIDLATAVHRDPSASAELRRALAWAPAHPDDEHGAGYVIRTGSTDVRRADVTHVIGPEGAGCYLTVPLTARGRTFGALTLVRSLVPHSPIERDYAEELARRAALAVDNAMVFAEQRNVALALQRALLPQQLPQVGGLRLAGAYIPGTEGLEVGGDWYDGLELSGGRLGIAIGDVMGRGARAATVMGQLRAALRSYAIEGHSPAQALARLDQLVSTFDSELDVTTCVYGVFDPVCRELTFSVAGHLPPLLVPADGPPVYLTGDHGAPLGVGSTYTDVTVTLAPHDVLMLYTDGLVESRDVAVDVGLEQLREALTGLHAKEPSEIYTTALRTMGRAQGHDDDVAVLVLDTGGAHEFGVPGGQRSREFPGRTEAARAARAFVLETLVDSGYRPPEGTGGDQLDAVSTALLLTSELTTNAIVHAGTDLRCDVEVRAGRIRVSVTDSHPALPHAVAELPAGPSGDVLEGGRGLQLVELLADACGVEPLPHGKTMWFELALPHS